MQIGRGRIKPSFDTQRPIFGQFLFQFILAQDFFRAAPDQRQ
jgi:hypothetical protein